MTDATLTITNSTFSGNSAVTDGGGICNGGTVTITNSTFSGNSAGTSGGGIFSIGSGTVDHYEQHLLRQQRDPRRRHLQNAGT